MDGDGEDQIDGPGPAPVPPGVPAEPDAQRPTFTAPSAPPPSYGPPPSFSPPPYGAFATGSDAGPPTRSTDSAAPPAEPPRWRALLGAASSAETARPAPTFVSMLAVGGGLLAAAGLFFLLGELDGYDQRMVGLAISLVFLVLGVVVSTVNRSSEAAVAGVAISVLSVVPLTVFLWANADVFRSLSGGDADGNPFDGIRGVVTIMLITAATVWLAGYLFGPGRRYGVYLGAALVALWLTPTFNIQITAVEDTLGPFRSGTTFEPIPPDFDSDSGFGSEFDPDSGFDSEFDSDFDSGFGSEFGSDFDSDFGTPFEEPEVSDPSTKLGVVSLAFGAVYLTFAAWRERAGDQRMATAALAPAILILLTATSQLTGHIGWVGWGLLAMVIGAALVAVGVPGGRRASSWIGVLVATVGFGSMVVEALGDSPRATGLVLTVAGVALALAVGFVARRDDVADAGTPDPDAPVVAPPGDVPPSAAFAPPGAQPF